MRIYRTANGIVLESEGQFKQIKSTDWDAYINRDTLFDDATADFNSDDAVLKNADWLTTIQPILPPIQSQEVWASGVTYLRSRDARMDESKVAGGDTFYDKVYDAERPELFFKASARRTVGTNDSVRIRKDSTWDVPEPELTLFITSSGKIVGYTAGNDMSSRSIEGENPLYLPQAKSYDRCASLGPCLYVPGQPIAPETLISLVIERAGEVAFSQSIQINQMKRSHTELVSFLFRECSFPDGVFLMTGTGIVPPNTFTLQSDDRITITIEGIGALTNWVE
ncbi:fumarylacetoacetate hydrolase family protein [Fibrivirga algicola]|uniref:2-hydroxyhepta-2,4-diene-1,7-dioate isomerase n=1 Tax=Fibrivirga algicola TaxID=2950420 RepID=A0ABX0QDV5_9BACT|nr:fumarylacetoacetate hydrolase family protein [Fibrivirga algicola]NID09152.1 2-hydroxyhepta-2,4-diene-1,7-dioate isomerase [Fibrivirga algicola]